MQKAWLKIAESAMVVTKRKTLGSVTWQTLKPTHPPIQEKKGGRLGGVQSSHTINDRSLKESNFRRSY